MKYKHMQNLVCRSNIHYTYIHRWCIPQNREHWETTWNVNVENITTPINYHQHLHQGTQELLQPHLQVLESKIFADADINQPMSHFGLDALGKLPLREKEAITTDASELLNC